MVERSPVSYTHLAKRSAWKSVLQPFTPLLLRWSGKGALKTLTKAEPAAITLPLQQTALYSGFYVNELITRVIEPETANPQLFQHYLQCLTGLATQPQIEPTLRLFEFHLLKILGYGIDFLHCAGSGLPVDESMTYQYRAEKGFIASLVKDNLTFYEMCIRDSRVSQVFLLQQTHFQQLNMRKLNQFVVTSKIKMAML